MLFILLCTEGEVTEPEYLDALVNSIKGQSPQTGDSMVDIISIPLGGNQGHRRLVESADQKVKDYTENPENLIYLSDETDDREKWLICDYDELDKSQIDLEELKEKSTQAGYTLILNKPNFEYFILALLGGWTLASATKPSHYPSEINRQIEGLNLKNREEKGFTDVMKIPPYSKKRHIARDLFQKITAYNPELLLDIAGSLSESSESYSDMPKLINRLMDIFNSSSIKTKPQSRARHSDPTTPEDIITDLQK